MDETDTVGIGEDVAADPGTRSERLTNDPQGPANDLADGLSILAITEPNHWIRNPKWSTKCPGQTTVLTDIDDSVVDAATVEFTQHGRRLDVLRLSPDGDVDHEPGDDKER